MDKEINFLHFVASLGRENLEIHRSTRSQLAVTPWHAYPGRGVWDQVHSRPHAIGGPR